MTENEKLDLILEKISDLDSKINNLEVNFQDKMTSLETDITDIKQKVTRIDLTVEDEIRVNIQRVAEGHLDLSRKLNECIKLSSDIKDKQELQDIFLRMHNNKLKAL